MRRADGVRYLEPPVQSGSGDGSPPDVPDLTDTVPQPSKIPDPTWEASPRTARLLVVALLAMAVVFWPTLETLHGVWMRYAYSHGYLTAPVVVWLAWRRRGALLSATSGSQEAIALLLLVSLVWLAAVVTTVQVIHQAALPAILLLWVAVIAGWGASRRFVPAAVVFLFSVPFWEALNRPLQALTAAVSGALVRAVGIQAEVTGEFIAISSGSFRVEGSCSGLGYLIIGLLIGTLYAHLFVHPWRTRIKVLALATVLPLLANWIRVGGLVVVGDVTEMQSRLIEDHGTYGWIVFVVVFFMFFPAAGYLRARGGAGGARASLADAPPAFHPTSGGAGERLSRRAVLATGLAMLGPLAYFGIGAVPTVESAEPADPIGRGEWVMLDPPGQPPHGWEPDFPEPDSRRASAWTDGSVEIHRLAMLYRKQEQGREVVGDGRIGAPEDVIGDDFLWVPEDDFWVREAFVRTPDGVVVVWYWFRIGGLETASPARAKALQLWAFVRRDPSALLVTLSAACTGERCEAERTAMRGFVAAME